jgi:hypothetical protein
MIALFGCPFKCHIADSSVSYMATVGKAEWMIRCERRNRC